MREPLQNDTAAAPGDKAAANDAGFTLIEVLIAFVILSVSLTVLLGTYSVATKHAGLTEARSIAAAHAASLLAQAGVTAPVVAGTSAGTFDDGFRWQVEIAPYGSGDDARAWPKGAYSVTASVAWGEGARAQALSLTSLRLGAPAP